MTRDRFAPVVPQTLRFHWIIQHFVRSLSLHNAFCVAPATNFAHGGAQSAVPATKSAHGGSQSAAPATKSAHEGSQSAAPATKSAQVQKMLHLTRNLHFKKQVKTLTPMDGRFRAWSEHDPRPFAISPQRILYCACHEICTWNLHMEVPKVLCLHGGTQSAAPATKSAHGGSRSAAPATKSALQEANEKL